MAQVVLDVNDTELGNLLVVLHALKEGMVNSIEVEGSAVTKPSTLRQKQTRYQPKKDRVIYEEEQNVLHTQGKYLDPAAFKKRLQKRS